eukprot:761482-Hanusia_phi.AAC.2
MALQQSLPQQTWHFSLEMSLRNEVCENSLQCSIAYYPAQAKDQECFHSRPSPRTPSNNEESKLVTRNPKGQERLVKSANELKIKLGRKLQGNRQDHKLRELKVHDVSPCRCSGEQRCPRWKQRTGRSDCSPVPTSKFFVGGNQTWTCCGKEPHQMSGYLSSA